MNNADAKPGGTGQEAASDATQEETQGETHVNEIPLSIAFTPVSESSGDLGDLADVDEVPNETEADLSQTLADSLYPAPVGSEPVDDGHGGTRTRVG